MSAPSQGRPLTSGTLARAAGVSADTLRHYEKLGLLSAERSAGGYRLYPSDALARVRMIRAAVRIGFSLAELAEVLKERRAGGAPCKKVAAVAGAHMQKLNDRICELTRLRDWLASTLKSWNTKLKTLKPGELALFLDNLPGPEDLNSIFTKGNANEKNDSNTNFLPLHLRRTSQCSGRDAMSHAQKRR